jgi:hypothetical protein
MREMGQRGRERARREFTPEAVAAKVDRALVALTPLMASAAPARESAGRRPQGVTTGS